MTERTSHTPGPWVILTNGVCVAGPDPHVPDVGMSGIAHCGMARRTEAENRANAQLVLAAPDLLESLQWREQFEPREGEDSNERFERIAAVFYRDTGFLRPGKDCRVNSHEERQEAWDAWMQRGRDACRVAIAKAKGAQA